MSIFGALLGDLENDPFMRGHMRRMNNMMDNFFRDPFADMMGRGMGTEIMPFTGGREGRGHELARYDDFGMGFPMMGFPNIGNIFQNMNNPNCHSFSSSTVMTMTAGPDGRPQVYQASQSVKQGPGGVRETKKTVSDTRTGVKKMAIGHHIHDRAHIIEREHNVFSGEQEERQDFINLDEEEAESFNKEWETKTRHVMRGNAIEYGKSSRRHHSAREPQLALPSTASNQNSSRHSARSRPSSYYSSSKPSTSALTSRSGEEESESESEGGEERIVGEKRKLPEAGDSSSEDEAEEPQPKKPMKKPQSTEPLPK